LSPATFVGGQTGLWRVTRLSVVKGEGLPAVPHLDVIPGHAAAVAATWSLRGVAGHARYVERAEKQQLDALTPPLGLSEATCAALIPIRKSAQWWALAQDERRAIFEHRSHHIADTLKYLPRVARRLYHARDLGEDFDFLTWFEYAPEHSAAFEELVDMLRTREEWSFVDREIDVRLAR
jgi:hypothetical protein